MIIINNYNILLNLKTFKKIKIKELISKLSRLIIGEFNKNKENKYIATNRSWREAQKSKQ